MAFEYELMVDTLRHYGNIITKKSKENIKGETWKV
jgi:hypothetical protein